MMQSENASVCRVMTLVGARPQFIKAAPLSAEFSRRPGFHETLVHSGQHYDHAMSQVFFDELGIPIPNHFLKAGSGSHARQTAVIMERLDTVVQEERPDWIVVYGDTNTTAAGAMVAAKSGVRLAHVEAGLRSNNRQMPEEINRIVADHLADLNFAPNQHAAQRLHDEGIRKGVHVVGDLMLDLLVSACDAMPAEPDILTRFHLIPDRYALLTVHRASNTDDPQAFASIVRAARRLGVPVLFPAHPRTTKLLETLNVGRNDGIIVCRPLSYREMIAVQLHARLILTDSGGVQKEAAALGVPCVTLREETEWVETLQGDRNVLAGANEESILAAASRKRERLPRLSSTAQGTAKRIADTLAATMNT